jgi:hypothetical protein
MGSGGKPGWCGGSLPREPLVAATALLTAIALGSVCLPAVTAASGPPPVIVVDDVALTFAGTGTTGRVTASFTAKRPGRSVILQAKEPNSDWMNVGREASQAGNGQVRFELFGLSHVAYGYRVVVGAWRGAPGFVSAVTEWAPGPFQPRRFGSPVMRITTANGVPITSKENYVRGTASLDGVEYSLRIRGRGNSTWLLPKKPYRIKLDTQAALLGMPADRDWALIANYGDHSLARNAVALGLSPETSVAWSPRSAFVEVILNGEYEGSYQLTEHIKAATDRVNLSSTGLLLEVDERLESSNDLGFRTAHGFPIVYQDPDDPSEATKATFEAFLSDFESRLYGDDFSDPIRGYAPLIDPDAFADWYLVEELFKNVDADFYTSCWFTWDNGKLSMGPLWDFDVSSGFKIDFWPDYSAPEGWWARGGPLPDVVPRPHHQNHWIARMLQDPQFERRVVARWKKLKPAFRASTKEPHKILQSLGAAADNDRERWSGGAFYADWAHGDSPRAEARFLSDWLEARIDWMDSVLDP